jgi:hypothetical protein
MYVLHHQAEPLRAGQVGPEVAQTVGQRPEPRRINCDRGAKHCTDGLVIICADIGVSAVVLGCHILNEEARRRAGWLLQVLQLCHYANKWEKRVGSIALQPLAFASGGKVLALPPCYY